MIDIYKGILKEEVKENLIKLSFDFTDVNDKGVDSLFVYKHSYSFAKKLDYIYKAFNVSLALKESDFISLKRIGSLNV
jgi:hypothetical protein